MKLLSHWAQWRGMGSPCPDSCRLTWMAAFHKHLDIAQGLCSSAGVRTLPATITQGELLGWYLQKLLIGGCTSWQHESTSALSLWMKYNQLLPSLWVKYNHFFSNFPFEFFSRGLHHSLHQVLSRSLCYCFSTNLAILWLPSCFKWPNWSQVTVLALSDHISFQWSCSQAFHCVVFFLVCVVCLSCTVQALRQSLNLNRGMDAAANGNIKLLVSCLTPSPWFQFAKCCVLANSYK